MAKIYLASPFFNDAERATKARIKAHLEEVGYIIIDPQPTSGSSFESWEKTNYEWGADVFFGDIAKIQEADCVVAIDWGMYSDSGTAWEIGYAYGIKKPVLVIATTESMSKTHSLMVTNGACNFITEKRFYALNKSMIADAFNSKTYVAKGITVS